MPAFILKILLYMLNKLCFLHSGKGAGLLPPLSLSPLEKDDGGRERRWREEMRRSFDLRHLGSRAPDGNNQADSGALPSLLSKYQRAGRKDQDGKSELWPIVTSSIGRHNPSTERLAMVLTKALSSKTNNKGRKIRKKSQREIKFEDGF